MGLACRAEGEQSGWWGHGASLQAQTLLVTSAGGPAGLGCPAGALVPQEELGSDAGCVWVPRRARAACGHGAISISEWLQLLESY